MSETTEVNRAAFGQFLNQLRREKGWTQKDLAERLYVSDKAVSKWERGLSLPDVALLLPLAGALGVSVTELLEGRRAVQEQRYSAAEVEALIRRALAFPVEPPERQQARGKRYLPVYLICCVLGVAEALAVWLLAGGILSPDVVFTFSPEQAARPRDITPARAKKIVFFMFMSDCSFSKKVLKNRVNSRWIRAFLQWSGSQNPPDRSETDSLLSSPPPQCRIWRFFRP